MKKVIVLAIAFGLPSAALAGNPNAPGFGQNTAQSAGGLPSGPHIRVNISGNGNMVFTGLGRLTAIFAQN